MSASLLYHTCGILGYEYRSTKDQRSQPGDTILGGP